MLKEKRIIPCLDVKNGRVVKGVQFVGLRDAGSPVELAKFYDQQGADELVLLDISASLEGREATLEIVSQIANLIKIPFTVGGGVNSVERMERLIKAGADKVSVSSAAVADPDLIKAGAAKIGSDKLLVAIDAKYDENFKSWRVYTHGGKKATDWEVVAWAKEVAKLGAGEILLTSMGQDGAKTGYNIPLTKAVSEAVKLPVIASGGAGKKEDFYEVFTASKASAALAASIFHYKETSVAEVKNFLKEEGVEVK